jgi:tetratricopeptide (TPR) repeat protein
VELDSNCGECHAIVGFILFTQYWNWTEADQHLRLAVALNPDDPQIRYWSAQLQSALGHPAECLSLIDVALTRAPYGFNLLVMKAGCLYFTRDYKTAVEVSDRALALNLDGGWAWRANALFLWVSTKKRSGPLLTI